MLHAVDQSGRVIQADLDAVGVAQSGEHQADVALDAVSPLPSSALVNTSGATGRSGEMGKDQTDVNVPESRAFHRVWIVAAERCSLLT